ncbi:hypothetical protein AB395_00006109 (plasmid) [Sinorhizobium fredii CCBAU 45436]|nr:hypothetical protein AB395_00006109 [Sinorhizobium fredii CCBAU 45436]
MFSSFLSYQQFWRGVGSARLLHDSLNRNRFEDKIMQHFQSATATLARPIGRAAL